MTDKVLWQDDDALSGTNLTEAVGQSQLSDFVEWGIGLTADQTNNELDVAAGKAFVMLNNRTYAAAPDSRSALPLTDGTVNHVYLQLNTDVRNSVEYHIDTDATPPTGSGVASLKVGEVDTSAGSTTELNRSPPSGGAGNTDEVLVGASADGADYQSLQAAINSVPEGNQVRVLGSYDSSYDTLPVVVDKAIGVVSNGTTKIGDTTNDLDPVLHVYGGTSGKNRPPGPWFRNLQVEGGVRCVVVENMRWTTWVNCHFTNAHEDGIKIDENGGASNSHALYGCTAESNGRDGFWVSPTSHAVDLVSCTGQDNGRYGARVSTNTSCSIIGGSYQINDSYGIFLSQARSCTVRDAYIENNCRAGLEKAEMFVGSTGAPSGSITIESCYFNTALGSTDHPRDYCVNIEEGNYVTFRDNQVNSASTMVAFVNIQAGSFNDVHRSSNQDRGGNGIPTITSATNAGTRTLDDGEEVVASGSVTLSGGVATVDTGVANTTTATFMVALGPATSDADVGAELRADSTSGNYEVDIEESPDTSVGNPTVEYDVVRVR